MNLHEYQSKSILKKYGVNIPEGMVAFSPDQAVDAAWIIREKTGSDKWAIKAQVHAGGRGKGGGIKIANSFDEVKEHARHIIGMTLITPQTGLQGKKVSKILVEQNIYYAGESKVQEYYMSILLNRITGKYMILYSPRGGMDIEQVAAETPFRCRCWAARPPRGFPGNPRLFSTFMRSCIRSAAGHSRHAFCDSRGVRVNRLESVEEVNAVYAFSPTE